MPSSVAYPCTDPSYRCRWVTENGRPKKINDCQNTGPTFCPQSKQVHSYSNTVYKYPQRFGDRAHCVKVWEDFLHRNARKDEKFGSRE
jgi:hypothetical protein